MRRLGNRVIDAGRYSESVEDVYPEEVDIVLNTDNEKIPVRQDLLSVNTNKENVTDISNPDIKKYVLTEFKSINKSFEAFLKKTEENDSLASIVGPCIHYVIDTAKRFAILSTEGSRDSSDNLFKQTLYYNGEVYVRKEDANNGLTPWENGLVGQRTEAGGEIFNDYKNNQAISDKTTSSGTNTIAGCKGFYWYDIDFSAKQPVITITDQRLSPPSSKISTGYAVGDVISIVNDAKYIDCATITAIGDNTITVDALPFTKVVGMSSDLNFDDYTLCVLKKPTLGTVDLGIGANASGEETKALGAYSNVKGKGNIGKGQYSDIGGRDNEGGYCARIGGRENKGGSYDLIGGYKNNSDGGANVIGGVDNLNDGDNNIMGGRDNINHGKNNVIGGAENLIKKGHHFIGMFGRGHISSALYQLFGGAWSKATTNTLFAIGNGSSDEDRSNAFEVLKDGRAVLGAEPTSDMGAVNKSFLEKIINALNFKNGKGTGSICLPSTKSSKGAYSFTSGYENVNDEQNAIVGGRNNENYGKNNIMGGAENTFQKGHHFGAMFGRGHISTALCQLFSGSWSSPKADTLLAVGNGTSDENRSNALEVHKDGRATLGAAPINDMDAVNKKYVDDLSNDKFKELAIKAEASGVDFDITDAAQMPLESLNIYGKTNQVHTTGKNLFCCSSAYNLTASGVTATADSGTSVIKVSGKATANFAPSIAVASLPAGTYTLSMSGLLGANDYVFLKNTNTSSIVVPTLKNGKSGTFTITEASGFVLGLVILSSSDYAYSNATVYLQIERGETATDYEPYNNGVASPSPEYPQPMETIGLSGKITINVDEQTLDVETPNGLPGIPVSSNGNYTDENGQNWICDEIDFEKGVYVQRINSYTITGTENWTRSAVQSSTDGNSRYDVTIAQQPAKGSNVLCNYYPYKGTYITSGIGTWVYNSGGANYLNLRVVTSHATLDEFKAFLAEKYNSDAPVTIQYILSDPIETAMSEDILASYKELHTNKPTTHIFNDANAHVKIGYIADTKTYIDSEIKSEVNQNFANALKGKATGEIIHIDDASPIEHIVSLNVSLENATETVENPKLYVCGKNLLNFGNINGDVQGTYRGWLVNPTKQKITASLIDKDTSVDISGIYLGICNAGVDGTGGVVWLVEKGEIKRPLFSIDRKFISIAKPLTMTFEEAIEKLTQRFYIQVEFGTKATSYEDFKGGKYDISESEMNIPSPASSVMNVYSNVPGALIECEYNQDTNAVIEKLINAVISLGGNI